MKVVRMALQHFVPVLVPVVLGSGVVYAVVRRRHHCAHNDPPSAAPGRVSPASREFFHGLGKVVEADGFDTIVHKCRKTINSCRSIVMQFDSTRHAQLYRRGPEGGVVTSLRSGHPTVNLILMPMASSFDSANCTPAPLIFTVWPGPSWYSFSRRMPI
jgi:hypothetical protein